MGILVRLELFGMNLFSAETGAIQLAEVIHRRPLEILDLRLNPIGPIGASSILMILSLIPVRMLAQMFQSNIIYSLYFVLTLRRLNLSGCQVNGSITDLIVSVLSESLTLSRINLSVNFMGKVIYI